MRRKKFFQNIGNIAIFGLGVTFVCFALYTALSYLALTYMNLQMVNYTDENAGDEGGPKLIEIDIMQTSSLACVRTVIQSSCTASLAPYASAVKSGRCPGQEMLCSPCS